MTVQLALDLWGAHSDQHAARQVPALCAVCGVDRAPRGGAAMEQIACERCRIDERFRRDLAEQRVAWSEPATCPSCGAVELDGWALFRRHGHPPTRRYDPTWPCRAQGSNQ